MIALGDAAFDLIKTLKAILKKRKVVPEISILDYDKQPTTDYVVGRPLVRIQVRIDGNVIIPDGYGLVDTGARTSMVHAQAVGDIAPDVVIPTVHGGGHGTTGMFSNCGVKKAGTFCSIADRRWTIQPAPSRSTRGRIEWSSNDNSATRLIRNVT